MARNHWRPTRWQRFRWWLEDWAPGDSLSGYVQFVAHRVRCRLGLKTELAIADWPKKPEKRVLPVTIDTLQPLGTCNPPPSSSGITPEEWIAGLDRAAQHRKALMVQLKFEEMRGKGGRRNGS